MILIKWHGVYLLRDGKIVDKMEFSDENILDYLKKLISGDMSPVTEFIASYPDEEILMYGDLKNPSLLKDIMIKIARDRMADMLGDDYILIQTLAAYDDVIAMMNLLGERLIELNKIEKIRSDNLEPASRLQSEIENLTNLSDYLANEIEGRVSDIAPNLSAIVGHVIAARLINYAGGIARMAKMPSSTIQVLGAEDAFFQHLKKGTPCPKHGIIFQIPEIRNSPKRIRGKISRALAGKLAIAARVDYYRGEFIGDQLKDEFKRRVEEIKNDFSGKSR